MSHLIESDAAPGGNTPEFTVSEISGAVKRSIEGQFGHVRVRGEIGRVSRPRSGHIYLDLKDDRSVLSGVVWRGQAARLGLSPEEGLEVVATGRLTTFPGQSKYQMVVESMTPAGVGALMAMLDKRRKALAAEGLFAPERKQPLPYLPSVIGVVTSPSGAVIRDILHRLRDRFPRTVLIWPVAVQGERCAPEVTRAIEGFNALPVRGGPVPRPDVLIVARGGGSVEDLWGFNEEAVVRAAAASRIPLISAVGHETDTTLIDHAADRRAPTPTAAAEMAVPVRMELLNTAEAQGARLTRAATQGVERRRVRLRDLSRALPRPEALAESARQRLDLTGERLPRALRGFTERQRNLLEVRSMRLRPQHLQNRTQNDARRLEDLSRRLERARDLSRERAAQRLDRLADRLTLRPVARELTRNRDRVALSVDRLIRAQAAAARMRRERLSAVDRLRQSFDHHSVLARGFVLARDDAGQLVTRREGILPGSLLALEFADGQLGVAATGTGMSAPARKKPKPQAEPARGPSQGSLFDEDG